MKAGKQLSFEEVRKNLENQLNDRNRLDKWRAWLSEQIEAPPSDPPPQ